MWVLCRACQHNAQVDEAPLPPSDSAASPCQRPGAKALPAISPQRCTGCGWCVAVCGPHVLSLHTPEPGGRKRSVLHDAPACTGCALCAVRCPFGAISMVRKPNA
ncbi:MAG: 4Fe-4S dicluster domain-containing protein [Burkholderiales bacterium]|nr:4Fe-4S dicluster domain-containing protein [Burkholderiales bacterium]